MNLVELTEGDVADKVHVGDTVLIRGEVTEVIPGVGITVEVFSKTDQYRCSIRLDLVAALVLADVPDEPADGSWLVGDDIHAYVSDAVNVFHRHDRAAPDEPERRWPRRWQVAGTGEWLDWPTAFERGADPKRVLHAPNPREVPTVDYLPAPLTGRIVDLLKKRTRGVTSWQVITWLRIAEVLGVGGQNVRASKPVEDYLNLLVNEGWATFHPETKNRMAYYTWNPTS